MTGALVDTSRILGKYEILDLLGKGGMGTVYRARDLVLERTVALKVLHPESAADPDAVDAWRRFLNEARAIARLNHPSIVSVYQFSETTPDGTYFAMEYVEGLPIDEYVRCQTGVHVAVALDLVCQLLVGLAHAHVQGVVHRDIKPSNLLVTGEGRLKITDFGVAQVGSLKHTQTGFMMGTPGYIAPERYRGGTIDQRCDIYSAGVLCYELLTGAQLVTGGLAEIVYQICHVSPGPVSAANAGIPTLLDPIVAKALAKDPAERYQTAMEFHVALSAARKALGYTGTDFRVPAIATVQLAKLEPGAFPTLSPVATSAQPWPEVSGSPTEPTSEAPTVAMSTGPSSLRPSVPIDVSTVSSAAEVNTGSLPGWSPEEISLIAQQLTPILGPMARIIVKRQAAVTRDRQELYEALARQLRTDEERKDFLAAVSRASGRIKAMAPDVPPKGPDSPAYVASSAIAPATLERTTRILARYIGPIAAVVVKKAAPTATDESDLFARVAERITNADERARFVAELTEI